jgi:hypothetical protein
VLTYRRPSSRAGTGAACHRSFSVAPTGPFSRWNHHKSPSGMKPKRRNSPIAAEQHQGPPFWVGRQAAPLRRRGHGFRLRIGSKTFSGVSRLNRYISSDGQAAPAPSRRRCKPFGSWCRWPDSGNERPAVACRGPAVWKAFENRRKTRAIRSSARSAGRCHRRWVDGADQHRHRPLGRSRP